MASNEIDRPLSHGCLTQLLKDQALVNGSFVKAQDPLSLHIFSKLNYCKTELFCLVSLLICSIISTISLWGNTLYYLQYSWLFTVPEFNPVHETCKEETTDDRGLQ